MPPATVHDYSIARRAIQGRSDELGRVLSRCRARGYPDIPDNWMIQAMHDSKVVLLARAILESETSFDRATIEQAQRISDLGTRISRASRELGESVIQLLRESRLAPDGVCPDRALDSRTAQFISVQVAVPDNEAIASIEVLRDRGYIPWNDWARDRREDFIRRHHSITLMGTDADSKRVSLRWRPEPGRNWLRRITDRFSPVRAGDQAGRDDLGPYLGTPFSLLPGLFELANLGRSDSLVDIGCGDGRVLVEAARSTGCHALGVDTNPELIGLAQARIVSEDLVERVKAECRDGRTMPAGSGSVVFMFLPAATLRKEIPRILSELGQGHRIVAHEQRSLHRAPNPDQSRLILGEDAMTVGHLWRGTGEARQA